MTDAEEAALRAALKTMNDLHDFGDAVYAVRESEGKGWEGPGVVAYSAAHQVVRAFMDGGK